MASHRRRPISHFVTLLALLVISAAIETLSAMADNNRPTPMVDLPKVEGLKAKGFSGKDINRVLTCSGIIQCPQKNSRIWPWATAFALESNDQLAVNAHELFVGKTLLPVNQCYFISYKHPRTKIHLKVSDRDIDELEKHSNWEIIPSLDGVRVPA